VRSYLTLSCRLPADSEDALTQVLESWPVLGCQVEDARPEIAVTVFIDAVHADDLPGIGGELLLLGAREMVSGPFADLDWLDEYRQHARPTAIGQRLWIDPNPAAPTPAPTGRHYLVIEPRRAFGTGSHESTRLVLEVLEHLDVCGRRVLDVGCGSGILALAACALGATSAVGFDIDSESVFVARQTVLGQPGTYPVALFAGGVDALGAAARFDVILANLLPAEFTPFLAALTSLLEPQATLVLSGLLADQRHFVESDLRQAGLAVERSFEQAEWMALLCHPA